MTIKSLVKTVVVLGQTISVPVQTSTLFVESDGKVWGTSKLKTPHCENDADFMDSLGYRGYIKQNLHYINDYLIIEV